MVGTRVGYAGGTTPDPTYERLGDHTETIEVDYDPQVTSYDALLDEFWRAHDPTYPPFSRQYRSAIFYRTEEECRAAEASLARVEAARGRVFTAIEPLEHFYLAEDYHQKYYWKQYERACQRMGQAASGPSSQEFADWLGLRVTCV